ncbi:MAG: DUF5709 domain-containing protein [Propionibacteriaceae bacterium]|jgi:hypothetical protein|nr:DUF5709 domain-containing protein [Propionibacteriaceae bacterium]
MTEMTDFEMVPDESEQLDQLQPDDTLLSRGVDDVLDEGYIAPDHWSPAQGFGNTAEEMAQEETIDQRLRQEEPETLPGDDDSWRPDDAGEEREVGFRRSGRLIDANGGYDGEDEEGELVGGEVGIDGGAACAEEAAIHIVDDDASIDGEDVLY